MTWLIRSVLAVAAIVLILLLVGLALPRDFKVQRTVRIDAPAAAIYPYLADPRMWPRWAVWNQRDPAMQMTFSGAAAGAGATWSWISKTEGNGTMTFTAADPDRSITYALSFPDFGMTSNGVIELTAAGTGTDVRWTNEGRVGFNPVDRYFALAMDRLVGPDFQQGLTNLKALVEKR